MEPTDSQADYKHFKNIIFSAFSILTYQEKNVGNCECLIDRLNIYMCEKTAFSIELRFLIEGCRVFIYVSACVLHSRCYFVSCGWSISFRTPGDVWLYCSPDDLRCTREINLFIIDPAQDTRNKCAEMDHRIK